jgi:hypothetical protein
MNVMRCVPMTANDECLQLEYKRMSNSIAAKVAEPLGNPVSFVKRSSFVIRALSFFRHSSFDLRH